MPRAFVFLLLPILAQAAGVTAFLNARVIDGTGSPAIEKATILIRDGKIAAVGKKVKIPKDAERIDASGKTILPGLVNAHGHVSTVDQMKVYLRDGITTLWSLGDTCPDARKKTGACNSEFESRDQSRRAVPGTLPRLYVAGPVITSTTPDDARKAVRDLVPQKPDVIKFREDDALGTRPKMNPETYAALIDEAHRAGFRVASHIVTLDDAKGVLKAGADFIAHSVRDREIDDEFIRLMKQRGIFYCPTFTREISVFIYAEPPVFFKDPFFLKEADPAEIARMSDPKLQQTMRTDKAALWYKEHLDVAMRNLKKAFAAGIGIAMGTDTGGGTGRFQGFFEHLELEYEVNAGLTPMQAIVSATTGAAKAMKLDDQIGSLLPGRQADLLILTANPLDDIRNTRRIDSVWVAGARVR